MNRNGPFQDRVGSIWDRSRVNIASFCFHVSFFFCCCLFAFEEITFLSLPFSIEIYFYFPKQHLRTKLKPFKERAVQESKQLQNLRAACCNFQLHLCKIEKFDFLKLCHDKGLCELVAKI